MTGALLRVLRSAGAAPLRKLATATAAGAVAELAGVSLLATATWLIVRAADQPPIAALGLAIVGVRAFALARGSFRYVERLAGHDAALGALAALRARVFAALERGGPARLRGGDALARLVADVDTVQDLLLRCLLPGAVAVVTATAATTLAAVLLPQAALAMACGLTLAVFGVPAASYAAARRFAPRGAAARAELATRTLDLVDGAAELAAYGASPGGLDAAARAARDLARLERATARAESLAGAAVLVLQAATTLGVAALSIAATGHDLPSILVPVLALTCLSAFEIATPLPAAARYVLDAAAAARRLVVLFDAAPRLAEPAIVRTLPDGLATVELSDIHVRYSRDRPPALAGVDLLVEPGQRVALVGPSGSGKSTLLAVLSRLIDIESGTYRVNGQDAAGLAAGEVRARVAGATQDAYVFQATLRDNLALARPDADDGQLLDALRRAALQGWVEGLPDGLSTVVGQDGASMSGGQRQRLVLARALLADPDVLLLDEPVEGLDPPTARAVLAQALDATRDRSAVLVTHCLTGLDVVDDIVVLDSGRVVGRGSHAELLATPGLYRRMWEAQHPAQNLIGKAGP